VALRRRGGAGGNGLEAWPGYVDALSTLLMVIIFVLLVFVLAQAFLSVALSGRDQALDRVNRQLAELSDMLSLERGHSAELAQSVARLTRDLQSATATRDDLEGQLASLRAAAERATTERDAARADRDQLAARLTDAGLQAKSSEAAAALLRDQAAEAARRADAVGQDAAATAQQLAEARRTLAEQVRALAALRDELERKAQDAAVRATTEEQRRAATEAQLADERKLGDSARAQIALLTQQVTQLRAQMAQLSHDLDLANSAMTDKDTQIANLGSRLNAALAAKVEELQRYRSEFFGRLRDVLANRPGVRVVGDRFIFQSEVLFPVGSAEMTASGQDQIRALAGTVKQIASEIPSGVNWILRIDGHADRQPVSGGQFASNWELSAERAIVVVKLLIAEGVPAAHLAATGFADNQPLDAADTPDAYARNRRIEIRLTDR
jgi:chemotaxis protein MotB